MDEKKTRETEGIKVYLRVRPFFSKSKNDCVSFFEKDVSGKLTAFKPSSLLFHARHR